MRSSIVPGSFAAAMLILGLAGVLLAPRALPRPAPSLEEKVVRASYTVVEPRSPIVDTGGVLVESLGIESPPGAFHEILRQGTRMPARQPISFATQVPEQDTILIHLLRGRSSRAEENHSLGWFRVGGLPPAGPGSSRALVLFRVAEGSVLIAALNPSSGDPLRIDSSQPPAPR